MARTAFTVLAAAASFMTAQAFAAPFAMITDLKGEAWALDGAQPRKLALLGYIENPTEIKVDPAGKLAITYFSNGVQYSFAGPARVALESGKRYRWKVDALGVAKPVSASGAFTVADDAARERAAEAKRSAGSELGARSFYATTLEAEGHAYDARAEWKALAQEYPNEPEIAIRSR